MERHNKRWLAELAARCGAATVTLVTVEHPYGTLRGRLLQQQGEYAMVTVTGSLTFKQEQVKEVLGTKVVLK